MDEDGEAVESMMGERILLIDDEESVLFAIHEYLTVRGHEVARAADRATAERLLDEQCFACVVTDLHLTPDRARDGIALARKARGAGVERIVLLTAHGSPEIEREAESAGIDRVLAKPVLLAELERVLTETSEDRA
jgi:two-component system OmpR family response regulator